MSPKELSEKKILIAKSMGYFIDDERDVDAYDENLYWEIIDSVKYVVGRPREMKYDKSWDALIPVFSKLLKDREENFYPENKEIRFDEMCQEFYLAIDKNEVFKAFQSISNFLETNEKEKIDRRSKRKKI